MIKDYLKRGEQNAIKATDLARLTGYATTRELQQAIHDERSNGELILSSGAGFFLPSEDKRQARREIERFIASLSSRAINTLGVLKTAKRVLRRLDSTPLDEIGA